LETGVVPTATGSAYLELEDGRKSSLSINPASSSLKLSCAVHGPKPLPRNANFSSNLQLTVSVKLAPFATRQRRGYIRDATERDIVTHLETALNGVIIPDRWPKSFIDVVITILEAEDDTEWQSQRHQVPVLEGVGNMNVVAGCITAASAALLDARIDCLDLVAGGVAATVSNDGKAIKILDPSPSEQPSIGSVCVVGYMPTRDELTLIWAKGDIPASNEERVHGFDSLLDSAVNAAKGSHVVLKQVAADLAQAQALRLTNDKSKT
jgi:exosome complex component MTR3